MKFASLLRTLRLISSYMRRPHGPRPDVVESRSHEAIHPFPSLVYTPIGAVRKTVVLIHGVSGRAAEDPSLVHLARCLAALGYRCVTPSLPNLAQFRHSLEDVELAARGIARAAELAGERVGVFSFSYGASFALCAAAHELSRAHCSAVLGFGGYYRLEDALEHQRQLLIARPNLAEDDADLAYLRYTLLASLREHTSLTEEGWAEIEPILINYTTRCPIERKRGPLLRHAKHINFVELMECYQALELPAELSPATVLGGIACPVGLLHDPKDRFVPANQAALIASALDRRPHVPKTRVLTTPMLSHVQVDPRHRLTDFPKLVDILDMILD